MIIRVKDTYEYLRNHPSKPRRWSKQSRENHFVKLSGAYVNLSLTTDLFKALKQTKVEEVHCYYDNGLIVIQDHGFLPTSCFKYRLKAYVEPMDSLWI